MICKIKAELFKYAKQHPHCCIDNRPLNTVRFPENEAENDPPSLALSLVPIQKFLKQSLSPEATPSTLYKYCPLLVGREQQNSELLSTSQLSNSLLDF